MILDFRRVLKSTKIIYSMFRDIFGFLYRIITDWQLVLIIGGVLTVITTFLWCFGYYKCCQIRYQNYLLSEDMMEFAGSDVEISKQNDESSDMKDTPD